MKKKTRILVLMAGANAAAIRFLSDRVDAHHLAEGKRTVVLTVTRTGNFYDPRYGDFEITREMLLSMVRNFEADVYGQRIVLDVSHKPQDGAAGFFKRLFLDGNKLRAEIELTEYGIEAIQKKGFIYVSAEFAENFTDNEERKQHGTTLLGAGLTPRPVIKRLDPVQLAEDSLDGEHRTFVSDRIIRILSEETQTMEKYLKMLRSALEQKKLHESIIKQLSKSLSEAAKGVDDETKLKALTESFITSGAEIAKQLAEAGRGGEPATIQLSIPSPAAAGMDEAAVRKLMESMQAEAQAKTRKLAEDYQARVGQFNTLLGEAKLEGLTDEEKKELSAFTDLITAETTEDQVKSLAERAIKLGNQLAASKQLSGMGFQAGARGTVHISVDESNSVKALQEQINTGLRGSYLHNTGGLLLAEPDKEHPFVTKVLSAFDALNAARLHAEHKALAAGTTGMGDTSLPAGFQRTVIREALSDLRVLELVQTLTDPGATVTTGIPYEQRDTSGVSNDGIVYEGNGIHRASIKQAMDYAYIVPMKLAFLISNEVMHFTRASAIDWDAYARNVESNARVMRELIVRRICNELQRATDAYLAQDIADEDLDAQLNGSTSTIKTAQFPIVRPHQVRDLQGNAVGSVENPITVKLNGVTIAEYDGTGNQAAGTYYRVTSYNLGYIQFVNESGAAVTPASTANPDTVTYSYATNVAKFDIDNGATALEVHLNGLLRSIGARKAVMSGDRFIKPDFMLMSEVLNDTITNADQFVASQKKEGSNLTAQGDLQSVKGIGAWSTNAPGVDLGDERLIMGQRGTLAYSVAKPFMTGQPFEAVDANGLPTGQKQAYGEEYSAIKVPTPIRNRLTSVLVYSATGR